jgi:hypothetical protein
MVMHLFKDHDFYFAGPAGDVYAHITLLVTPGDQIQ